MSLRTDEPIYVHTVVLARHHPPPPNLLTADALILRTSLLRTPVPQRGSIVLVCTSDLLAPSYRDCCGVAELPKDKSWGLDLVSLELTGCVEILSAMPAAGRNDMFNSVTFCVCAMDRMRLYQVLKWSASSCGFHQSRAIQPEEQAQRVEVPQSV